jgi:hypothetical protein
MSLFDRAVKSTASTLRINGQTLNSDQVAQLTSFLHYGDSLLNPHLKPSSQLPLLCAFVSSRESIPASAGLRA